MQCHLCDQGGLNSLQEKATVCDQSHVDCGIVVHTLCMMKDFLGGSLICSYGGKLSSLRSQGSQ